MATDEQAGNIRIEPTGIPNEIFDAAAFLQPKTEPSRQHLLGMDCLLEHRIYVPLVQQHVVRPGKNGSKLALPFVICEGPVFEQGLTGDPIKDRYGPLLLDAIEDNLGDMVAGKIRGGFANDGVMPRNFI
jgi:hypothetical protein